MDTNARRQNTITCTDTGGSGAAVREGDAEPGANICSWATVHRVCVRNLCGCAAAPAAGCRGDGADAVPLENLLGVFQHGFVAELQVQLKTREHLR